MNTQAQTTSDGGIISEKEMRKRMVQQIVSDIMVELFPIACNATERLSDRQLKYMQTISTKGICDKQDISIISQFWIALINPLLEQQNNSNI